MKGEELPDLSSVPADLTLPALSEGMPKAGRRVRHSLSEYAGTQVYHVLYLPTDWKPGKKYPLIVEYAGNGGYSNRYGDVSQGVPEGSTLGYGLSAGEGFLWLCLPYIEGGRTHLCTQWWGDVEATLEYCKKAVRLVCEQYGGDSSAVILAGFSRGAIACGYLGLHDDEIARLWRAFIAYSHYDGVRKWPYPSSDAASAVARLKRLKGRPSFVCSESGIEATRSFIAASGVQAPFTFQSVPFRNHNDAWVLRDTTARVALRAWLSAVLTDRKAL